MNFQRGLTEKAKLERKGPAVLAAGVFDIRRPRVAVSRACLSRVSNPYPNPCKPFLKESQGGQKPSSRSRGNLHPAHRSFPFSTQVGHLRPSSANFLTTSCQEAPNLTPRSPKRAQRMPKIAENTPKSLQPRPPRPQNVANTL